jgi:hypothetical protein
VRITESQLSLCERTFTHVASLAALLHCNECAAYDLSFSVKFGSVHMYPGGIHDGLQMQVKAHSQHQQGLLAGVNVLHRELTS